MKAVVQTPVCPLMTQPRPDCALADEALLGMVVEVLEQTSADYWRVGTHYRYEGYAPVRCLLPGDDLAGWWSSLPRKMIFFRHTGDVMAEPRLQSWPLATLPLGAAAALDGAEQDGWQAVLLPDGRRGYLRSDLLSPVREAPPDLPEEDLRQRITGNARRYLGASYRWGGKTPLGIDCSGLVSMSYLLCGIVIYRDAELRPGFPIHPIPLDRVKPGDLLFFPGHVALYLDQDRYIHSTAKEGSDGVVINSLDPNQPDYRPDLPGLLTGAGSFFPA